MASFCRRAALPLLLLLGIAAAPAEATPDKMAMAFPVEGITVDGDLSDWPEDMIRYPILFRDDGDPLRGPRDFEGSFRVGYSQKEGALYVAVEVSDDSVVRGRPGKGNYRTQDGCEIYLNGHQPQRKGKEPVQYYLWGPNSGTYGPDSFDNARAEVKWGDQGYQWEWRIDIAGASGGWVKLRPELIFGFDVAIWDRDRDGTSSWIAWSPGAGKYWNADMLGRLVLVEKGASVTKVLQLMGEQQEKRASTFHEQVRRSVGYQMFFSGVLLTFTLLHLLLFLFDPRTKANLFYAVYTGFIAVSIFSGFQLEFTSYIPFETISMVRQIALLFVNAVGLCFLYSLFNPKPPRRFWVLLAGLLLLTGFMAVRIGGSFDMPGVLPKLPGFMVTVLSIGLFVETLIVLFNAVRQRKEGAWTIGIGFSIFALNISPLIQQAQIDITLFYWVLIPLASMSVYLARSVTRTNKALQRQLVQVEELSQKTREQYEQIQEQNRQIQEANRLKSDFLARMSHDLRTPMNAIIGYTRILLRKTREQIDERQYRNLENVQVAADNLLTLINDILDISKIEAGRVDIKVDQVDLAQLTAACISSVESLLRPGVELSQELEPVASIRTDSDRIRRVIMNLLSNAVKFTEEGRITVSLAGQNGGARLTVADTGVGIPAAELPHIFEEFRQVDRRDGSRREGTGLGLAIAKRSMELLKGRIEVESEEGTGSVFTLWIGDYEAEGGAPASPEAVESADVSAVPTTR